MTIDRDQLTTVPDPRIKFLRVWDNPEQQGLDEKFSLRGWGADEDPLEVIPEAVIFFDYRLHDFLPEGWRMMSALVERQPKWAKNLDSVRSWEVFIHQSGKRHIPGSLDDTEVSKVWLPLPSFATAAVEYRWLPRCVEKACSFLETLFSDGADPQTGVAPDIVRHMDWSARVRSQMKLLDENTPS